MTGFRPTRFGVGAEDGPFAVARRRGAAVGYVALLVLAGIAVGGWHSNPVRPTVIPPAGAPAAAGGPRSAMAQPLTSYTLTIQEAGLPIGTPWLANCNFARGNSTGSTITFAAVNGSYVCGVAESNSQAYLTYTPQFAVNLTGTSVTVNVTFEPSYLAYFTATGLPNASFGLGITWTGGPLWVGDSIGGSGQTTSYPMLNGTYNFTAESCDSNGCSEYIANPPNGTYSILGGPAYVNVSFVLNTTATLTFQETGLGFGQIWSINLTGTNGTTFAFGQNTSSSMQSVGAIRGLLAVGPYAFSVSGPTNVSETASPSSGSVLLTAGARLGQCIEFTSSANPIGQPCAGYTVTFSPVGLPSTLPFCVNLTGPSWGCSGPGIGPRSVLFGGFLDGTYAYSVPVEGAYNAYPSSGNFQINNTNASLSIAFARGPGYNATFSEGGLPSGTDWGVNVSGSLITSNTSRVVFAGLPNGSYAYRFWVGADYSPSPSNGTFSVQGANVAFNVSFAQTTYAVTFVESGLPSAATWRVVVGTQSQTGGSPSFVFDLAGGTYSYAARASASHNCTCSGTVTVPGTSMVPLSFSVDAYTLQFTETGAPMGDAWGIVLGTRSNTSTSPTIDFSVPNGSYSFVALPPGGFVAAPASGSTTVAGANVTVSVAIRVELYPIAFIEFGLPAGSNWSVHVANASLGVNLTASSTTNAITIFLPNGTFDVTFALPAGYSAGANGTVITVAGAATPNFDVRTSALGPLLARPAESLTWLAFAAGVGAVSAVGLVSLAWWLRRRQG